MSDTPDNLVLVMLRDISGDMAEMRAELALRLDRIHDRIDRVERRPSLAEAF